MASGAAALPPRTFQIDWTDRCNIDCFFCSQADMRRGRGELPLAVLERCFFEMEEFQVETLNVAGGGDPLFHHEIVQILEAIRPRRFRIGTITTNAVLARARVAELLLETTREQISVSLNSLNAEDYGRVMRTSPRNFDRVLDNVRALVAARRAAGASRPLIAVQFLVHDATRRQLPAMLALAQDLGVDRVAFSPLQFFDDQSRELLKHARDFLAEVALVFRSDAGGIVADIRTIHPEINQRIDDLRRALAPRRYAITVLQHRNFNSLLSFCTLPWFNMHVKATGDVYPCCALLTPDFRPFGNLNDQSLGEIWWGEPYRRFRVEHAGFSRSVREGDRDASNHSPLPKPCTVHGMCFLRALPYLDDTPFAVSVDALGRCHPQVEVRFPERLRDGEWAVLSGPDPGGSAGDLDVFVNRMPCGRATREDEGFSFRFRPEPLSPGFHLLEVRDPTGRVLAARMVEKDPPLR
jgi:MoaA/NifB/PqqE/SkfB family radical SAM enzyme